MTVVKDVSRAGGWGRTVANVGDRVTHAFSPSSRRLTWCSDAENVNVIPTVMVLSARGSVDSMRDRHFRHCTQA